METQNKIQQIQDEYQIFSTEYEMRYPKPEGGLSRYVFGAVIAMLVASVIVSASETVPFFIGRNHDMHPVVTLAVAVSVVIMIEIAIIVTSHLIVRFSKRNALPVVYLLFAALIIAMSVAVSANIVGQLERRSIWVNENINTIVSILAASAAPFMALIAGVVFAVLEGSGKRELTEWRLKKNSAWTSHKRKYEMEITVSKPIPTALPGGMEPVENVPSLPNSNSNWNSNGNSGIGYSRKSNAMEKALEHYRMNPDDLERSPVTVAKEIGVSKSTMYNARNTIEEES